MDRKDFSHLGEDIKDIVSEAVGSIDFEKLNQDINKTVKDALEQAKAGLSAGKERMQSGNQAPEYRFDKKPPKVQGGKAYLSKHPSGLISGTLMTVFGAFFGSIFGITAIVMFCLMLGTGFSGIFEILFAVFFLLAAAFVALAFQGNQKSLRVKRFYQYVRILGERTFCDLDELAAQIGKDKKFVVHDVRKMISERMFLQGYIDDQETCLMITEESYQQYRAAQKEYKRREEKEKRAVDAVAREADYQKKKQEEKQWEEKKKKKEKNSIYDNEEIDRELLNAYTEGRRYLDEISKVNRDISEPEISEKISHMEVVIRRIFKQVQNHPEQLEEIRRFMEYYLPTTLKLVTAYSEFESQPIQGETIAKSKREIEETLDTINGAFEKLLDSLFEAAALDISTDISVMNTMFAQEGLKKDMFEM
jgi:5-bromo-4-chloroindolyl phosphate hydrolysis protein